MSTLEKKLKKIAALDTHREEQREKMNGLLEKKQQVEKDIKELEVVLEDLDERLETLEEECLPGAATKQGPSSSNSDQQQQQQQELSSSTQNQSLSFFSDDLLTDPTSQTQHAPTRSAGPSRVSLDTQLTEPSSQLHSPGMDDEEREGHVPFEYSIPSNVASIPRPSAGNSSSVGQLEIKTVPPKKKKAPGKTERGGNGSLDRFFGIAPKLAPASVPTVPPPAAVAASAANIAACGQSRSHSSTNRYNHDNFPWSTQVQELLRNTFRIQHFREHQKEVINCTLAGKDAFVLMRTGGGKSLTYQLPALFEGRGRGQSGKVTFVISPLLSLIKDQEEQMNAFAPGSAISFTSNVAGGQTEHARRWNLVRDPQQGVCLVLVTPEKVHKSNKLKSEMQKLYQQNRLGRFVVDEAHCSSNWGHDFRPDYTKLGILRVDFPDIPILAVTATASDRVRYDVCDILHVSRDCAFFRSSANRPNLTYQVRPKKASWSADAVIDDMAAFIKNEYPQGAGIVYTFSRKDADTVASKLLDRGIVAESYHSDVKGPRKDMIHQSWMRNDTQVVVATIAFGLGINKPDVRFVLHHTISKTLEAYYQESGRAGRDGKPSQCVLYYSPKDVPRMGKMVHGESDSAEIAFWHMVRYAQASGGDAVCRAIILENMGETGFCVEAAKQQEEELGITERRDISKHAKTVVEVLQTKVSQREKFTLNMLVKEWRTKPANALSCVVENPPGSDLNADECERVVVGLLVEGILRNTIVYTAYDSVCYLDLSRFGQQFLSSKDATVVMTFPKREGKATINESGGDKKPKARKAAEAKATAKKKARKSSTTSQGKKKAATKKAATSKKRKQPTTKTKPKAAKKRVESATNKNTVSTIVSDVIELMSSDDDSVEEIEKITATTTRASRPRVARQSKAPPAMQQDDLWDDSPDESNDEFEFE